MTPLTKYNWTVPLIPITKSDHDEQFLFAAIALVPDVIDAQDHGITAEEIEDTAHQFMLDSQAIGADHDQDVFDFGSKLRLVESFIAPVAFSMGGVRVLKGSWVLVIKVLDTGLWQRVKNGEFGGLSIDGRGHIEEAAA